MPASSPDTPSYEQLLLGASSELLLLLDGVSLRILAANRCWSQTLGYPMDAVLGQAIGQFECALSDLFFWDDMPDKIEVRDVPSELSCANGTVLQVLKSVRRISLEPLRYTLRATLDVKQSPIESDLANMSSRLRATLEATADGILLMDHEGALVNMNQHFSDMWRLPDALLSLRDDAGIAAHMQRLCRLGAPLGDSAEYPGAPAQTQAAIEVLHLWDGRVIERAVKAATAGKEVIGQVYSYRDVTERHRSQQELIAARDEAKRASLAKSEFLAMMSHEIRTPLNGVLGVAELLAGTALAAVQADYVRIIRSSGQTLLTILNDVLDFSKIEAGKLQLDQVDFSVTSLVSDIAALFAYRVREDGPRFHWHVEPTVPVQLRGDPVRLRQILFNLLGNAFKFTEHGQIELRVAPAQPVPAAAALAGTDVDTVDLRFSVRDTGIGLSVEQQRRMFVSFEQADQSITRKYGGTGLGLAICKRLSEMMQGQIGVDSVLGVGSEFWFTARLAVAAPAAQAPVVVALPEQFRLPTRLRVLLVDDHPVNRMLMRGLLKRLGIVEPVEAENGQIAMERAIQHHVDLVLMDVQMPVMDGQEATRRLRQLGFTAPIIGVSAAALAEERQASLAAGMNDYVLKPVTLDTLRAAMARALGTCAGAPAD